MIHRPGGGLIDGAVHGGGPMLGDDDAVGAHGVGGANNGAEIVGIFDAVQEHDERILAFFFRQGQHIFDAAVGEVGNKCHDALMVLAARHFVQAGFFTLLNVDAQFLGPAANFFHGAVFGALLNVDFIGHFVQGFQDGVSAVDHGRFHSSSL